MEVVTYFMNLEKAINVFYKNIWNYNGATLV